MPAKFAEPGFKLRGAGLILPASAPVWATRNYVNWEESDPVTMATGDAIAVAAWHIMLEISAAIRSDEWEPLVTGFVARGLADGGGAVAWAIHVLQGIDELIVKPHAHPIVTARGQRCPAWIGS